MNDVNRKLTFALIGCGNIAKKHLACIQGLSNAELVGVFDIDLESLQAFSEENAIPGFSSIDMLLAEVNPDVIVVLTPSGSHASIVKNLAKYKKHIIVEKPISLTLADAYEMKEECDRHGSTLSVVKQNRFNAPIRLARKMYDAGELGSLFLGTVRVRWSRDQNYYDSAAWRGTWENDGGVICNQAIHHIDMLQWFLGDVSSVFSSNINAVLDIEAEDTSVSVIKFTSGALGIVEASTAIRPKDLEGSISLLGNKGSIEVGGFAMNKIVKLELEDNSQIDQKDKECSNPSNFAYAHIEFYKDYLSQILADKQPTINAEEAIKSLRIVHAIYKSHHENREVFLAEDDLQTKLGLKD